jgi:hypothetical protein
LVAFSTASCFFALSASRSFCASAVSRCSIVKMYPTLKGRVPAADGLGDGAGDGAFACPRGNSIRFTTSQVPFRSVGISPEVSVLCGKSAKPMVGANASSRAVTDVARARARPTVDLANTCLLGIRRKGGCYQRTSAESIRVGTRRAAALTKAPALREGTASGRGAARSRPRPWSRAG